jgi:hypothetical protein
MYGLKEAAIIAFNQLVKKLAPHGYAPTPYTPGLWHHKTKRTTFVLCVDDFGVKYFSQAVAQHLIIRAGYIPRFALASNQQVYSRKHWNTHLVYSNRLISRKSSVGNIIP